MRRVRLSILIIRSLLFSGTLLESTNQRPLYSSRIYIQPLDIIISSEGIYLSIDNRLYKTNSIAKDSCGFYTEEIQGWGIEPGDYWWQCVKCGASNCGLRRYCHNCDAPYE